MSSSRDEPWQEVVRNNGTVEARPVTRTVLIHLNVEVRENDTRNADEIADFVLAALEVGLEGAPGSLASGDSLATHSLTVCCPLAEEV